MNPVIRRFLTDAFYSAVSVVVVSILIIQLKWTVEDMKVRTTRAQIAAMAFDEIVKYHAILAPRSTIRSDGLSYVYYGSDARFISDFEVLPAIETIPGGVQLSWDEVIECNHTPYIPSGSYEFWREAEPTSRRYVKSRNRRTIEGLESLRGYVIAVKRNDGFLGQLPAIQYPNHDANCQLVSTMRMTMPSGEIKRFEMRSEEVHVRGVIPE